MAEDPPLTDRIQSTPASSHRLPTQSASQILSNAAKSITRIPTSIPSLDNLLGSRVSRNAASGNTFGKDTSTAGGFVTGTVNEIWGPPGAGTTALCLQIASNALEHDHHVIWIDSSLSTPYARLSSLHGKGHRKLTHYTVPTLSHLLALILHPPPYLPLATSSVLILHDIHHLFDACYPRYTRSSTTGAQRWAPGRRSSVISQLSAALRRLSAVHSLLVIVTTGCATQVRQREQPDVGAVLVPGLVGAEWDAAIATRLVVARDFRIPIAGNAGVLWERRSARFIGVQKLGGTRVAVQDGVGFLVRFEIGEEGLGVVEAEGDAGRGDAGARVYATKVEEDRIGTVIGKKRARGEVADSEDEAGLDGALDWIDQELDVLPDELSDDDTLIVGQTVVVKE